MSDNIIRTGNITAIFNGGEPLEGCPESWEQAERITEAFNEGKEDEPLWRFDCGFKLDFDGAIISISSRFYPPKTHYGSTWDGKVSVYLKNNKIAEKSFDCKTLDELKEQVEKYVDSIRFILEGSINAIKEL